VQLIHRHQKGYDQEGYVTDCGTCNHREGL
jgi:hypothetical protein